MDSGTNHKSTQYGGGDIIGMPFQSGGGLNQPRQIQGSTVDLVESGEHAKADGGTAAETTRAGDMSTNYEAIWFPWEFSGFVISRYDF